MWMNVQRGIGIGIGIALGLDLAVVVVETLWSRCLFG
jgi:hypothetical protein